MSAGEFSPNAYPPQPFSDVDWDWFSQRSADLGLPLFDRQRAEALYAHLSGVNAWMNLTRLRSERDYLKQHLLDSLTGLRLPELQALDPEMPCVDLGAGGGYPSLPLASMTEAPWVLVDSRGKKVTFLQHALSLTGNNASEARQFRGREAPVAAPDLLLSTQLLVSRAVGQTALLMQEAAPMLAPDAPLILYKGPQYEGDEHKAALKAAKQFYYVFDRIERLQLEDGDPERLLVVYRRKSNVPDQY